MSSFAGFIVFGDGPISRQREAALAAAAARNKPAQRVFTHRTPHALFAQLGRSAATRKGILFASSSRLDNGADIAAAASADAAADEAELIRRIFEARGDAGIARLLGAFAFAHWDEGAGALTLARDCIGKRCLFYHAGDGFVAFASNLAVLLALHDVPRQLDERMLANFLALNHRERETTFYRGICRVPSRTVVRITLNGIEQRPYWSPNFAAPPPFARDEDYIARARELFDRAVARTLRATPRVAITLSGGFDSSAVAATAARLGTAEIACYTALPPPNFERAPRPGWYLDERFKVEALARLHPSLRVNFITSRGAHLRQSDPARYFPNMPVAHRNLCNLGWFAPVDDAMEADGHSVVLHGGRGNMTTSWDGKFSLAAMLSEGRWLNLLAETRTLSRATGCSMARVLASEAMMPLLPAAAQRAVDRLRGRSPEDVSRFSLLRREIVDELDLRRQWRADGFDPSYRARGTSARLRAHKIFDQLQLSRDMVGLRFDAGGYESRDPYADRELVEFCLSVPETLYRRAGVGRSFARAMFADRLPREILEETGRGEQAPNWFESLDARKPIIVEAAERLEASPLASRLIDLPRLKRLIAEWPSDAIAAEARSKEYRYGLDRAVHLGQFIRWVEGGNA